MTVRTMYILGRKPGMSFEEFRTHWKDVHMPLAARVPGIVKYVRRLVVPEGDEPDNEYGIDGFAALDYESVEAMDAGWASEAGQRALADVPNFLGKFAVVTLDDDVIIDKTAE